MRRTFHINSFNNESNMLNIAECINNTLIKLSINNGDQTAEIVLDYNAFEDLCGLRYSLDLVEAVEETVDSESIDIALRAA